MRVNFEISTHWLDEKQKSKISSIADTVGPWDARFLGNEKTSAAQNSVA